MGRPLVDRARPSYLPFPPVKTAVVSELSSPRFANFRYPIHFIEKKVPAVLQGIIPFRRTMDLEPFFSGPLSRTSLFQFCITLAERPHQRGWELNPIRAGLCGQVQHYQDFPEHAVT